MNFKWGGNVRIGLEQIKQLVLYCMGAVDEYMRDL